MSERRTAIIGGMLTAIYTPAMPQLVQVFGTTDAAIKMSLSLYFGGFAIAQLAAAMMGFIQMSVGFLGGVAAAWIGSPLPAFGIIIPAMHIMAAVGYIGFRMTSRKA